MTLTLKEIQDDLIGINDTDWKAKLKMPNDISGCVYIRGMNYIYFILRMNIKGKRFYCQCGTGSICFFRSL